MREKERKGLIKFIANSTPEQIDFLDKCKNFLLKIGESKGVHKSSKPKYYAKIYFTPIIPDNGGYLSFGIETEIFNSLDDLLG